MVNIKDKENPKRETLRGKLEEIFIRQNELLNTYKEIEVLMLPHVVPDKVPVDIHTHVGQDLIRQRFAWCMIEICEALDCLKNKPWKQTMVEVDIDHFREEVADALHFFIEACILAGIEAEDLYDLYMRKSEVNKFRQRSKY